ncbi:MAG: heat-shock protein Hsp70 [Sphingobacteriales bacterium UTBCD1]|jgi:molecular chaperone DnaK|nr:MAG: heat-shock protein Hsp70 [Sphingobacteriales bacterium UTBCD1]
MRNKIDYGIDLGTTNSAIARMENGVPTIKRSDTLKDTVPSCVHFNKRKDILAGDTAFNVMKNDNTRALKSFEAGKTNTFIEFKRTMGTTHTYKCSNMGKDFTSEELSAEVLKKLKSFIQDENINSIVITVPAKFLNPQNEATMKAAKLAGFKHIQLLHEPVAAATAYGLTAKNKDSFWCVFDFGGGTFDAALVKSEEGILSVKDTDGDNWLGGKNLDLAIVDELIIPTLQKNYSINSILADTAKRQLLRDVLKFYAEEIKIEMSTKASVNYVIPLGSLKIEDEEGINLEDEEIEIVASFAEFENVVAPIFQKAIDITKELLKRNNLKGSDLGALILVGGPTFSPILRRMLKEQITDKVDTSVDPMTVVAKGAALFASTITVSDEVKEETRDKTKLQLDIKYRETTVELEEDISIKVLKDKITGKIPERLFVVLNRTSKGVAWSSNKKEIIIDKVNLIQDIKLEPDCANSFTVQLTDEDGNNVECQPNQFTILQGIDINEMQVLPYHIGIAKYFPAEEKDLFEAVKGLEKNKRLPATGVRNGLKTRSAIRPGIASDIIRIPIYQGDYKAEGTNPVLNNLITEVIISGEKIPKLLPEGSDVNITIKVDRSQIMKFTAEFPTIEYTEELKIEIKQTEAPTEEYLTKEISKAKRIAQKVNADDVAEKLDSFEEQLENEKGSADGKMKILDGLRKELLKLKSAEKSAEYPKVKEELKEAFYELEDLIEKIKNNGDDEDLNMNQVEAHLVEYRRKVEYIIKEENIREAKELTDEIIGLIIELRNTVTGGDVDRRRLEYHDREFNNIQWKDKNKARQLVNQGLKLIADGKTSQLRTLLHQIWDLRIDPENNTGTLG